MLNIAHLNIVCQDPDEIPVEWPTWDDRGNGEPVATPLADLHPAGVTDAAGMDAEVMTFDEWVSHIPAYELEPEFSYFEDEVTS